MGAGNSRNARLEAWLATVQEEALDPAREIVDPHHHLFNPVAEPRGDISLAAKVVRHLSPSVRESLLRALLPKAGLKTFGVNSPVVTRYLAEELHADFAGHNVKQTVIVEAQYVDKKGGKPEFFQVSESKLYYDNSLTAPINLPHACVCFVDLRLGKDRVTAALAKHKEVNPNLRGLRHQLAWHPDPLVFSARHAHEGMSRTDNFRGGLQAVQEAGLVFDIFVYHTQLKEAAELVQAFPEMQFVLDHVGTPIGIGVYAGDEGRKRARKEWEEGILAVAALPNVVVKLSGLFMPVCGFGYESRKTPPTSDQVLADSFSYFQFVFEAFGEDRCMFASNFPVDRVSMSYGVLFNTYKKVCDKLDLADEVRDKLFSQNARKIYKLEAN